MQNNIPKRYSFKFLLVELLSSAKKFDNTNNNKTIAGADKVTHTNVINLYKDLIFIHLEKYCRQPPRKAAVTGILAARIAGNKPPIKPISIAKANPNITRLGVTEN
jgi:hypothetical protein